MRFDLYTRLHLWLMERRRLVLIVTALVALACLVMSSRIKLEEDILDTLPENDPRVEEYKYALRKFRQIDRLYFDVGVNSEQPETLALAADQVFAVLSTNTAFSQILYRFEPGSLGKVTGFLTGALPRLFTEADVQKLALKTEPAAIREYLTAMRRRLAGPEGVVLKDIVAADPIGASALVLEKVMPLQVGFGNAQLVDGRITSGDGQHVLILAEPKFPSSDSGANEAMISALARLVAEVEKNFPGVHVAITGGHRMAVDNATLIKADAKRCVFIGMTAMFILCLVAFRRRWLALVAFLPSFVGMLLAGLVLALWEPHLSAIAMGFAVIAIGITVDYAIHVIYHLDDSPGGDQASLGRHIGRLILPITLGSFTTVAAFGVMIASPMRGHQQLGFFGFFGVLFSAAFALVILPLIIPVSTQKGQPPLWLTRWMTSFHVWSVKHRGGLLIVLLLFTIATAFGVKHLRFDGDLARLNGITEATRKDEELIRQTWGNALGMTLVVARGTTIEEALAQNDLVAAELARTPGISDVHSLAPVCPSQATQEANLKRWQEFWTPARQDALRQTLQTLGSELGFRAEAFDPFWKNLAQTPPPLSLDLFRDTPLEQALNERVALGTNDQAISSLITLKDRSQLEKLRQQMPGIIVLDRKDFADHIASLGKSWLHHFTFWTGIIVAVIVLLTLGSFGLLVAVGLPLVIGLVWTFGLMGWLGLPIDMMNCVFVIFIIGVSEDYSVFMVTSKLSQWRGESENLGTTSASVLISTLTTVFGFAVLVFAQHPVLFSMGTTVLIGMLSAFVATLVLTPLCMDLLLFKDPPRGAPRWWHLLTTLWVVLVLGSCQLLLYCLIRPLLKIFSPGSADQRSRQVARWLARGVVKAVPFGKLEYQNITAATFSSPSIAISNHQSAVDVILMMSLPGDLRQTAKKRVFDSPLLGFGCKLLGHIMVEPNDPQTTLRRCREKLAEGATVHFYPEGTRSYEGFSQRFHRGAFELAVELKQDVLPIVICDSNTAMPRDAYWFEPYHATVRALPRITPKNFDYTQGSVALMRHCELIMRQGLQAQLDAINTPRVVRRKVNRLYRYQSKFIEQFVFWKMKCDPLFTSLDAVVPRQGFILDLGCGYGEATHWLACFTRERTFLGVDYDADKIRVAQRSAPGHPRIKFNPDDILEMEYPPCDAILLLDVLHYWEPQKQQMILEKARRALRPGGRLILRDGVRADSKAHQRIHFMERLATAVGHNKTKEGLHFQSLTEIEGMLKQAGFDHWEIKPEAGRDSNVMLVVKTA